MSDVFLNSFLFSTPQMTRVFSSLEQLRAMARFEWALGTALEQHGLADPGTGEALSKLLSAEFVDMVSLVDEAAKDGNITIPFVRQLTEAVKQDNEAAARWVHFGATSQDLLDTALVLQMRAGLEFIEASLNRLDKALLAQIKVHRESVMLGRTWLQPGPPVTFGLKLAGTLAALRRARVRLSEESGRALTLQFGGAVGTLASLGDSGRALSARIAQLLNLPEPLLPWHTQRDSITALVQVLATTTGTLAKLGTDIALLMQPEIGEVTEGGEGRGGSSTMPHKRNPVACAALRAIHARMPGLASTMLLAMPQEHERGLGLWQAEWETVPEAFRLASASIAYSIDLIDNIEVHPDRMQANFKATLGLPLAESVSAALVPRIGMAKAHELLRRASTEAVKQKRPLSEVLQNLPDVTAHLTNSGIRLLLDPSNYLGSAGRFIATVMGDDDAHR